MHHPSSPGSTDATRSCQQPPAVGEHGLRPAPDQLTRAALPLVDTVARRLWLRWGRRHELEELAAIGRAALVPVVRAYDPARAPFVPYVVQRIRWAIQDGVRAMTHGRCGAYRRAVVTATDSPRAAARRSRGVVADGVAEASSTRCPHPFAAGPVETPVGLDSASSASAVGSPEEELLTKLDAERVRRAVACLPNHERVLVVSHYFQGRRFDHVAAHLGISKSWASRLHNRALRRLSRALVRGRPGAARRRLVPTDCGSSQRSGAAEAAAGCSVDSSTR